jgi:hypothetical protein
MTRLQVPPQNSRARSTAHETTLNPARFASPHREEQVIHASRLDRAINPPQLYVHSHKRTTRRNQPKRVRKLTLRFRPIFKIRQRHRFRKFSPCVPGCRSSGGTRPADSDRDMSVPVPCSGERIVGISRIEAWYRYGMVSMRKRWMEEEERACLMCFLLRPAQKWYC